jgi:DNA-binding NtrC family response regulator
VARLLIVDDEAVVRRALRALLERVGHEVTEAGDGAEALLLLPGQFDLLITDLTMPRMTGLEVVREVRERAPNVPVLVVTASTSISDCVDAMRSGAYNFLVKPWNDDELLSVVGHALEAGRPAPRPSRRISTPDGQPQAALIGESAALRRVLGTVEQVAASDATVLLLGESGVGKEVVARLLHAFSPRVGKPFVALNCGAIPENLVESELFGHARGAFTGAVEARPGRFVEADGGTLFLDEVGELPLAAQVKLLRVLQERVVTPLGEPRTRSVNTRVVAATNRDLEAQVQGGKFRSDLFFRLNVVPITLPPLRERREDVGLLAQHFLESANRRHGRAVKVGEDARVALALWSWPGNVRELENLVERLVLLCRGSVIGLDDLPGPMRGPEARAAGAAAAQLQHRSIDLTATLAQIEALLIDEALRAAEGNKSRAAELLTLNRTTLLDKLRRSSGG